MKVKIVNKSPFPNPEYKTSGSSGMDLTADLTNVDIPTKGKVVINRLNNIILYPNSRVILPTNIFIQLPEGYEAQIRPRSGQSFKKGFLVANSPGTIDSDYTGNVGVIIYNPTNEIIEIAHGERIAQMVITKYERVDWECVNELKDTDRGSGGFGHTGV